MTEQQITHALALACLAAIAMARDLLGPATDVHDLVNPDAPGSRAPETKDQHGASPTSTGGGRVA